ncbi:hypothetical protein AXF42_Ash014956 [Apostasia shenzhenica]|uniref:Uncharacterized protein n=1 Tax=Apostasia shenzhenica TaxID=1088818 RepID=A0A2I0ALL5_9ASPA|nr:hypothetical protein AXF42_Ash014956 [Apostasia shenzhenica]
MASFLLPSSLVLLLLFLLLSTPAALWLPNRPPPPSSGEAPELALCSNVRMEIMKFPPNSQFDIMMAKLSVFQAGERLAEEWQQQNRKPMPPEAARFVFRELMTVRRVRCLENNHMIGLALEVRVKMGFEDGVLSAILYIDSSVGFRLGLWTFVAE